MGWRFHKSIRLLPGLRLNLGRRSASILAGVRGAHISAGSGGTWLRTGIPGTGISYRERLDGRDHRRSAGEAPNGGISWFRLALLACLGFALYLAFRGL
jgi:hypothetical protein